MGLLKASQGLWPFQTLQNASSLTGSGKACCETSITCSKCIAKLTSTQCLDLGHTYGSKAHLSQWEPAVQMTLHFP